MTVSALLEAAKPAQSHLTRECWSIRSPTQAASALDTALMSFVDKIRDLYGPVYFACDPVLVWIDGTATGRSHHVRAGAASGVC